MLFSEKSWLSRALQVSVASRVPDVCEMVLLHVKTCIFVPIAVDAFGISEAAIAETDDLARWLGVVHVLNANHGLSPSSSHQCTAIVPGGTAPVTASRTSS